MSKRDAFAVTAQNLDEAVDWVRRWNAADLRFVRGVLRSEPAFTARVFKVTPGDGSEGWLDMRLIDGSSLYVHPGEVLSYAHLGRFTKS